MTNSIKGNYNENNSFWELKYYSMRPFFKLHIKLKNKKQKKHGTIEEANSN